MIKKIVYLPWYIVQVFTEASSFKRNPVIGNTILNRLGLHVIRLLLSHFNMYLRMLYLSLFVPKALKKEYFTNGYILLKDVLPQEDFETFSTQAKGLESDVRENIQGDTITHRIHLDQSVVKENDFLNQLLADKKIIALFKFTAGENRPPISYLQAIKNSAIKGKGDPQKVLHSDTFHPTMKYWFFLDDVKQNESPFTYVKGSHKLTFKRLKWEYNKSIHIDKETLSYAQNGSFRFTQEDLDYLGLGQPEEVCVPKNTLVLVNTFGLHRRGASDKKHVRSEVFGISRTNPFILFPGFDFNFLRSYDNWKLKKFRDIKDKEAQKKGGRSAWHNIGKQTLL